MASEHAFLRQRLALVEHQLAKQHGDSGLSNMEQVRRLGQHVGQHDLTYKRESRLLRKLLARTREGQVLTALKVWRRHLGTYLGEHRQQYKEMQEAYDAWWRLPRDERGGVPKPPRPPSARYTDVDGAVWIIDDRFLALLDDLMQRLQKWLNEE
jgi:hypothetical protein